MPFVMSESKRPWRFSAHMSSAYASHGAAPAAASDQQRSGGTGPGNEEPIPADARQPAHECGLHRERDDDPRQRPFRRHDRRHGEGDRRDPELEDASCRGSWAHRDEKEREPDEHREVEAPPGLEHLRPVGVPGHRQVDRAESGKDDPADREQGGEHTKDDPAHRRSISDVLGSAHGDRCERPVRSRPTFRRPCRLTRHTPPRASPRFVPGAAPRRRAMRRREPGGGARPRFSTRLRRRRGS